MNVIQVSRFNNTSFNKRHHINAVCMQKLRENQRNVTISVILHLNDLEMAFKVNGKL